jgi:hypothetical protein
MYEEGDHLVSGPAFLGIGIQVCAALRPRTAVRGTVARGVCAAAGIHNGHHFVGDPVERCDGDVAAVADEGAALASADFTDVPDLGDDGHCDIAVNGEFVHNFVPFVKAPWLVFEAQLVNSAAVAQGGEHLSQFFIDAAKVACVPPVLRPGGLSGPVLRQPGSEPLQEVLRDCCSLAVLACGCLCRVRHPLFSLHDD